MASPLKEHNATAIVWVWRPWEEETTAVSVLKERRSNFINCCERTEDLKMHKKSCGTSKTQQICNKCGKLFTRKDNLTRHMKTTHNDMKASCKYCFKPLSRKDAAARHQKKCQRNPKTMKPSERQQRPCVIISNLSRKMSEFQCG